MLFFKHSTFSKCILFIILLDTLTCRAISSNSKLGNCSSHRIRKLKNQQSFLILKGSSRIYLWTKSARWQNLSRKSRIKRIKTNLTMSMWPGALKNLKKTRLSLTRLRASGLQAANSKMSFYLSPWTRSSKAENLLILAKTHTVKQVSLLQCSH